MVGYQRGQLTAAYSWAAGADLGRNCARCATPGRNSDSARRCTRSSPKSGWYGLRILSSVPVGHAPTGYAARQPVMRKIASATTARPRAATRSVWQENSRKPHATKLSAFEAMAFAPYAYLAWGVPDPDVIEDEVEAARERMAALDGVEPHTAYGVAAEELALYRASVDLLIVGSRRDGPVGRLVHGSTAQQLARSARCPLLVLTRAALNADPPNASQPN